MANGQSSISLRPRVAAGLIPTVGGAAVADPSGHIGRVIREARREKGLNQVQLGRLCGYSQATISRIEKSPVGTDHISVLKVIAGKLGIAFDLLGLASSMASVAAMQSATHASDGGATSSRGGLRYGTLKALRDGIERWWSLDNQVGSETLRSAVVGQLNYAKGLLHACPEKDRRELIETVVELSNLAGWMNFDTGLFRAANEYFDNALVLSRTVDDRLLSASVLATRSLQAIYENNPSRSLALSMQSLDIAGRDSPNKLLAMLSMQKAFAQASLGDPKACEEAISEGHKYFEKSRLNTAEPSWISYYDEAKLLADTGVALARVGKITEASEYLISGMSPDNFNNPRMAIRSAYWKTVTALESGDLESACDNAYLAISQSRSISSARIDSHISKLSSYLKFFGSTKQVKELNQRIRDDVGAAC